MSTIKTDKLLEHLEEKVKSHKGEMDRHGENGKFALALDQRGRAAGIQEIIDDINYMQKLNKGK